MSIRPIIKYPGGKWYLKNWIIENFPENYEEMAYFEPFCGACSVVLNKEPSVYEVISDIDKEHINLLKVIKHQSKSLISNLKALPYKKEVFEFFQKQTFTNTVDRATQEYIVKRMSRCGMGKDFSWQNRLRGGKPGSVNEWETSLLNLEKVAKRFYTLDIWHNSFRQIFDYIDRYKSFKPEETFIYLDPPYLQTTRTPNLYRCEMSTQDHIDMIKWLKTFKGKFLLSGYDSDLYANTVGTFAHSARKDIKNHSGQNKKKQNRTEVLWMNY